MRSATPRLPTEDSSLPTDSNLRMEDKATTRPPTEDNSAIARPTAPPAKVTPAVATGGEEEREGNRKLGAQQFRKSYGDSGNRDSMG